jgi:hypothetical protein
MALHLTELYRVLRQGAEGRSYSAGSWQAFMIFPSDEEDIELADFLKTRMSRTQIVYASLREAPQCQWSSSAYQQSLERIRWY